MADKTLRVAYARYPERKAELKRELKIQLDGADGDSDSTIWFLTMIAKLHQKMEFYLENDNLRNTPFEVDDIDNDDIVDLETKIDNYDFSRYSDPEIVREHWKDILLDIESYIRLILQV